MPHAPVSDPFAADASGLPVHGGDLAAAELRFGRPAEGWLDLSTGINPWSYPLPELDAAVWHRLPDAAAEQALRLAAAVHYGAPGAEHVVCAPGTSALIRWLPLLLPRGEVTVVGPTYAEHATGWAAAGHRVEVRHAGDIPSGSRYVVVVSPNNPDGRRPAADELCELAVSLAGRGGLVVVDEAFADAVPEVSLAGRVGPGLVVLRSFGKFFGLAGLRLGFALCQPELAGSLRTAMGPWAVSGPAVAVGRAALADAGWIRAMRRRLTSEAAALDRILEGAGLGVLGGTPLFRLVSAPRAWSLYEFLGQRGILVRPFAGQPRWLRLGLPGGDSGAARLAAALAEWRR